MAVPLSRQFRQRSPARGMASVIVSNLVERVDRSAIHETDPNLWRAIRYRTPTMAGVMLGQGGGPEPVPITIRLGVQGRFRIRLGMTGFFATELRLRLTGDLCCQRVGPPESAFPTESAAALKTVIHEVYWKEADLTGQDIIVEGFSNPLLYPAALAYIALLPGRRARPRPRQKVSYPLAITNDGDGIFGEIPHSRPEDLLESLEALGDDTCMRLLVWGIGNADSCNYPTKVGNYITPGDSLRHAGHVFHRNLALWQRKGWDSLRLLRDYTRRRGWEFHPYVRIQAFAGQFPFDVAVRSSFFHSHPECHCLDRDGQPVGRLSYAYPAVQEHMLGLIAEIAGYGPDGVCLCLTRGVPLVLYEPIMVEGFRRHYGTDPRTLPERDARWADYRASIVTSFLEKVRGVLPKDQRLSVIFPGSRRDCREWGLDVAAWVRAGIVNDLFPVGQRFNDHDVHYDDPQNLDFAFFDGLRGREHVRLIPMFYPWDRFAADYPGWRQVVRSVAEQGADGYAVWDGAQSPSCFARVADIGFETLGAFKAPEVDYRNVQLLSMGGFRTDRYHYYEVV